MIKPSNNLSEALCYQTFFIYPRIKKVQVETKQVKKVEIKKDFVRENSVFSDFKAETKQLYKKCFDYDIKYSKINRLIRDIREVRKYIKDLKHT
jgi:hypothetical protein